MCLRAARRSRSFKNPSRREIPGARERQDGPSTPSASPRWFRLIPPSTRALVPPGRLAALPLRLYQLVSAGENGREREAALDGLTVFAPLSVLYLKVPLGEAPGGALGRARRRAGQGCSPRGAVDGTARPPRAAEPGRWRRTWERGPGPGPGPAPGSGSGSGMGREEPPGRWALPWLLSTRPRCRPPCPAGMRVTYRVTAGAWRGREGNEP